jgi:phosphohistidine phosphatase
MPLFFYFVPMKRLLLIRHAKAVHDNSLNDFERPLKPSGLEDAAIMAMRLENSAPVPQAIISSPALRTLETANVFSEHLSLPAPLTDREIYNASEGKLLQAVSNLPAEYDYMALVGHNPGISQLLYYYTGQVKDVPTCAVALIDFEADEWKLIRMDSGKLVYYSVPDE